MKMNLRITFLLVIIVFSINTQAQDTIIIADNFKYKLGAKFIVDHSNDYSLTANGSTVMSGGFQIVRKIGNSKSSLETGIYELTKASGYGNWRIIYNNISVPVNYRFDTRVVYISGGLYFDYLISKQKSDLRFSDNLWTDRKFNIGFNLCLGIEKQINKQLSLIIEARTFNALTSSKIDSRDLLSLSYSNNGFAIGMNYKFLR